MFILFLLSIIAALLIVALFCALLYTSLFEGKS